MHSSKFTSHASLPFRHLFYGYYLILNDRSAIATSQMHKVALCELALKSLNLASLITEKSISCVDEKEAGEILLDAKKRWLEASFFQSFRNRVETLSVSGESDFNVLLPPLIEAIDFSQQKLSEIANELICFKSELKKAKALESYLHPDNKNIH